MIDSAKHWPIMTQQGMHHDQVDSGRIDATFIARAFAVRQTIVLSICEGD